MAGAENVPVEWLQGSPFHSYFIPGLFLFLTVGGIVIQKNVLQKIVLLNSHSQMQLQSLAAKAEIV